MVLLGFQGYDFLLLGLEFSASRIHELRNELASAGLLTKGKRNTLRAWFH